MDNQEYFSTAMLLDALMAGVKRACGAVVIGFSGSATSSFIGVEWLHSLLVLAVSVLAGFLVGFCGEYAGLNKNNPDDEDNLFHSLESDYDDGELASVDNE